MSGFNRILFVVPRGGDCSRALRRAAEFARVNQSSLTLCAVVDRVSAGIRLPGGGPISEELQAVLNRTQEQRLSELADPYRSAQPVETRVLVGERFLEVIRAVLRDAYDLVIKPADPTAWTDRWFGSDDMHLLRKCPCPVWLHKPEAPESLGRVLAAVDLDESGLAEEVETRRTLNRQIVDLAAAVALGDSAELHVAHVWYAIGESVMRGALMSTPKETVDAYVEQIADQRSKALQTLMRDASTRLGRKTYEFLNPRTHLVQGFAEREIPNLVERVKPDLLVMGTVARTGVPGFIMGNTAETILGHVGCSVLAVKPAGFQTPIEIDA